MANFVLPGLDELLAPAAEQQKPDMASIMRAIYIQEGGRKAKTPYGYRPDKPTLYGPDPWQAKGTYDELVRKELDFEWDKFSKARQANQWPTNVPAGADFIKWLARHGYNANSKEWDGWEAGVRRAMKGQSPPEENRLPGLADMIPGMGPLQIDTGGPQKPLQSNVQMVQPPTPGEARLQQIGQFGGLGDVWKRAVNSVAGPSNFFQEMGNSLREQRGWKGALGTVLQGIGQSPVGETTARIMGAAAVPGDILESLLTRGQGFEQQFIKEGSLRGGGTFSPAALVAFGARMFIDPTTWIGVPQVVKWAKLGKGLEAVAPTAAKAAEGVNIAVGEQGPKFMRLRDAMGRFTKQTVSIEDYIKMQAERQAEATGVVEQIGPPEYIRLRDKNGQMTSKVVLPGSKKFTAMMDQTLEERLLEVSMNPAPLIQNLVPKGPTPELMQEWVQRITAVTKGQVLAKNDKKNFPSLVRQYLEAGGDASKLPTVVTDIIKQTRPELISQVAPTAADIVPKAAAPIVEEGAMKLGQGIIEFHAGLTPQAVMQSLKELLGRTFLGQMIPNESWLHDLTAIGKDFWRYYMKQSDVVMKSLGEHGTEMFTRAQNVYNQWQRNAGGVMAAVEQVKKQFSAEEWKQAWYNVRASREGVEGISLTPKEMLLKEITNDYLDVIVPTRGKKHGLPIELLDHYWPQSVDWQALGYEGSKERILAKLVKEGMAPSQAEDLFDKVIMPARQGRPFGNLERERTVLLDYSKRKDAMDEFLRYVIGTEKRFAEIKHFGMKDEVMNGLLSSIENMDDQRFAKQWLDFVKGNNPWHDKTSEMWVSRINGLQAAAKLPLAVIGNATQTLNTLLVAGPKEFTRGMMSVFKDKAEAVAFAQRAGVILDQTLQEIKAQAMGAESTWAGKVLDVSGFNAVERMNRVTAAVIGREWFNDLVSTIGKKSSQEQLIRAGFSPEEIARFTSRGLKGATENDAIKAARWMVEKTQFLTRPGDFPLLWNHPLARLLLLFKRFAYKQGQLMWESIITEGLAKFRPHDASTYYRLRPLAVAGAIFPLMGEAVADSRLLIKKAIGSPMDLYNAAKEGGAAGVYENIREGQPKSPLSPGFSVDNAFSWYIHSVGWMGALGLASDALRAIQASPGSFERALTGIVAGPTASDVVDITTRAHGMVTQDLPKWFTQQELQPGAKPATEFTNTKQLMRALLGITPGGQLTKGLGFLQSNTFEIKQLKQRAFDALDSGDNAAYERAVKELYTKHNISLTSQAYHQHLVAQRNKDRAYGKDTPLRRVRELGGKFLQDIKGDYK